MKIAIFHDLPSGGALRVAATHVERLRRSHDVTVFTLSSAGTGPMARGLEGTTVLAQPYQPRAPLPRPFGILDPLRRWCDLRDLDHVQRRLAATIDREGFDVVLVHPCLYTQAPLLLRHLRTRSLYVCHELPRALYEPWILQGSHGRSWRQWRNRPLEWLLECLLRALDVEGARRATTLATVSDFMNESIIRVYHRWAHVLRWGVDARFSPTGSEEKHTALPPRYFLSVGALGRAKGFGFLVEAVAALPRERRLPLVLVHDRANDGHRLELERQACEKYVDLVFLERIPEEMLAEVYRRAELTLYAPILEPLGLVPLESAACGTPVIGVREGGVRETIAPGITGLLTERDPQAFARAIDTLLSEPGTLARMRREAPGHIQQHWSWTRSIEALEELMQK